MLSFKPTFLLSFFTFIKRVFSSCFLPKGGFICISEAIGILLAILIPACASSTWAFNMMYSAYKLGFHCGSAGKEFACNLGDLGSIPGLGRSPGEGENYPLQYSGLENSMDCIVHGVTKSLDMHLS